MRGRPADRRNCAAAPRLRPDSMSVGVPKRKPPGKNSLHESRAPLEESIFPRGPLARGRRGSGPGAAADKRRKPPGSRGGQAEGPNQGSRKRGKKRFSPHGTTCLDGSAPPAAGLAGGAGTGPSRPPQSGGRIAAGDTRDWGGGAGRRNCAAAPRLRPESMGDGAVEPKRALGKTPFTNAKPP